MNYIKILYALCIVAAFIPNAAFGLEEVLPSEEETLTIVDYIDEFVDIPAGGIDWKLLGKTQETEITTKDEQGYDYSYAKPVFPADVKALDGQTVILRGFIFPLDGDEKQKQFLIGPFPVSCPFHYHVGPALVVEVSVAKKPVTFTYDPVTVKGRLELVADDPEFSTFYRLHDAQEVK